MTAALNTGMITELFGDKEARWCQIAARNETIQALEDGYRRICIIQPTGTGKTISAGLILMSDDLRRILNIPFGRPIRVLFISHRHRLLTQAEATYSIIENIELIQHSMMSELDPNTEFDVVLVDECHHEATMSFQHQLEQITTAPIIGLTATEGRLDGRLCKFDKFIEPITRQQAVEHGFLAETDVVSFVDSPERNRVDMICDAISLLHEEMGQQMVFVRTNAEAEQLHQRLAAANHTSSLLVNISERELNHQLDRFEQQKYQFAISCMKIGEGVDVKGCEGIIRGRNLTSIGLYNQMIGRAARIGSACRVYEFINPLSADNISAVDIVGVPRSHRIFYKVRGEWRVHQLI